MILQEQIIKEIKQIPNEKLEEIYDLIHYFRLGVAQEKQNQKDIVKQRPIGLSKGNFQVPASFFEPLTDEMLDAFEGK
ncbi:MAG: hypothetical protein L3J75_14710 [Methylococcaceae bacterium]|nr:hypothetical protein [Methylococcaceae bacterium]